MTERQRPRRRRLPASAHPLVGLALVGLLAACSSSEPDSTPTPTSTLPPVPTVAPDAGDPIGLDCDELVTPERMQEYSASVRLEGPAERADSDQLTEIVDHSGLLCRWNDDDSGNDIEIGVASLDEQSITALANHAVRESNAVPTYGSEGYFAFEDGSGTAQIFDGDHWIVLVSADFTEPGVVAPLADAVLDSLG